MSSFLFQLHRRLIAYCIFTAELSRIVIMNGSDDYTEELASKESD